MTHLILGLIIFLGVHSVRIVADDWRTRTRARFGERRWKALYSAMSALGLVLIVWGFGLARAESALLWSPPIGMRLLATLLSLTSFVLLAAAYVPGNNIQARLRHPMVLAVGLWALAHLLANGSLAHIVLFGAFLIWAIADFRAAVRRDRTVAAPALKGAAGATGISVAIGAGAWAAFTLWGHGWLTGVYPLG